MADVGLNSILAGCRVERLLGRGAMGAVYLAEDLHLKRKVAIKVLAPELAGDARFRQRFLLESQLAAGLEHPHIVPIYAAGEQDDVLFLAMKYVDGYDLRGLIGAEERMTGEQAVALLAQVGDALDAAHSLGLVHRDVKPANILIAAGASEHAYLCDFGLARHASTVASLTGERSFVGTIAYIAPEQIESGVVDARADVYSLACVLFESLAGVTPFARDGDLQVVFAHLKEPPPLLTSLRPDLPDAIDTVLAKGLAKAPDDRFSTCGELVAEAVEALRVAPPEVVRSTRRTIPGVRTFLIADIRGYTRYTAEHGDEAAATLASRFADIVRTVVEEREGRLIELRGDEALVVFDSARGALRSAVELQARVAAELPLGVGVGLDAGEAVPVADGYRGGALNLAARLCSLAAPGETLATETVLQLARTVDGIRYGERRSERLKGYAKPVTAVEIVSADRRRNPVEWRRFRRALRRRTRSRIVQASAGAVVAAGVAAALFLVFGAGGAKARQIAANSLGFVSSDGKLQAQLRLSGSGPLGLLDGTLWLGDGDNKTLQRIDPRTHKLLHPSVGVQDGVAGMTTGFGSVWVVDGTDPALLRVDPHYLTIQKIDLPADKSQLDFTAPMEATVGAGSVWVAEANKVFRIDPETSRVVKSIDVPAADLLAFGEGALWVGRSNLSSISKIDPALNRVVATVHLRNWVNTVAVGGGYVWATVTPDDTLWRIDPQGSVDKTLDMGHGVGAVTYFDGATWVSANGLLQRVDPTTDEITSYPVVDRTDSLLGGAGTLFVSAADSPPTLPPLPADQVATFSLAEDFVDDTDPAHAWPGPSYRAQLEYATGAQLLNYPDAPAPRGSRLVPDAAAALPTVSADGRMYTFRIRRGMRFSPPSKQAVTAQTFKYSIERALSPRLGPEAPGYGLVNDIVGATAFHANKAHEVAGIVARGDILTIRLTAPAGDFLARLSTPFFAAVPVGTPIVTGGVQTPIPSAGPYYIKVRWQDELVVLERNPNYHGPRPHRLQRIVYDLNNSTRRTVARIESGDADYAADVQNDSTFARTGTLAARYGRTRPGTGRAALVWTPVAAFSFLQLNTRRAPFDDPRLRRAVNYAIDRRALAALRGDSPSAAYIPPGLPGAGGARSYPLTADVAEARRLAHGVHARVVLLTCNQAQCDAAAEVVRTDLDRIGLTVRVRAVDDPFTTAAAPGADYDLLMNGWYYDYPDPSEVLNGFLDPAGFRPSWLPPPLPVPAATRRALERAAPLTGAVRAEAYRRLAGTLERDVAPFVAYGTPVLPEFFSGRLGCRVEQPVIGAVDIGALCIRS
jgi:ABC-type transport system substrate-binding protein/class 3 adenylate cyclase/streptogramin lyase